MSKISNFENKTFSGFKIAYWFCTSKPTFRALNSLLSRLTHLPSAVTMNAVLNLYVTYTTRPFFFRVWKVNMKIFIDNIFSFQPPRSAHPVVKFTCSSQEPMVIDNLPFDKYELEPSPLTQFILARKQPTTCWQVCNITVLFVIAYLTLYLFQ